MVSQQVSQDFSDNISQKTQNQKTQNQTAQNQTSKNVSSEQVLGAKKFKKIPVQIPVDNCVKLTKNNVTTSNPKNTKTSKQKQSRHHQSQQKTEDSINDTPSETLKKVRTLSPSAKRQEVNILASGNGSIFKTTNKSGETVWKIEVTIGKTLNGKRIRTRRTAHSLSEARTIHRKLIAELDSGNLKTKTGETFAEYAIWWVHTVKSLRVKPRTLADYEDRLRREVFPHFGTRPLDSITSREIETWLHLLQKQGKAVGTINGARQVMKSVYSHAVKTGLVNKNPVENTDKLRQFWDQPTNVKEPWNVEEAKHVLEITKDTDFDLFTRIALLMGARRGEILGLRWQDVNFIEGHLTINCSLQEHRSYKPDGTKTLNLVLGDPKTRSSKRKIYLSTEILAAFQRHIQQTKQRKEKALVWADSEYVFVNSNGGAVYPNNFAKKFVKHLEENNIRHIRIHDMRHTAAVLALEAGVRLEAVSQGLGHSRIDITKTVYAPYVQPLITEFSTGLADYLSPLTPPQTCAAPVLAGEQP